MDLNVLYICILAFLFLLAIFDLFVGVSNDAVNFLSSAVGSKAAPFKHVLTVAAIGVFIGAAMSNGMMDIARHGIFHPGQFSFYELMCIFMAVMVTDIILLDIFNSLGMPTSTTVSMVFELLGATFVVSLVKMASDGALTFSELLNTEKALQVIIGIFLSVAIAFVFGSLVQFITRTIFSFNYKKNITWKIGIFGGLCATAIIYFLLIKGAKDLTFMTPEVKAWIAENTWMIVASCFAVFSVLMQILHFLKVSVLKVVVLMGTFALAMAFAGNDLVNFIGVPLTGLDSYLDFAANGAGDEHGFLMNSLNSSANTPVIFLIIAGVIMTASLATSKKAHNVTKTSVGLGSQSSGEEMFGSSRIARRLVRWALAVFTQINSHTPESVRNWFSKRFDVDESIMENGAAFDLLRGAVNLVLAGALIALGTSMKLPLSTTFVTFMVAMGTSLSDRAWGRESAVFRITGVISVVGGWFMTAGAAFIGAGIVVAAMYWGGHLAMIALAGLTLFLLWHSNRKFTEKQTDDNGDRLFQTILSTEDKEENWQLLSTYITERQQAFLTYAADNYKLITTAFLNDDVSTLYRTDTSLQNQKQQLKSDRRKETLCLRRLTQAKAIEKSAWFHLSNNCCMSILYNLRRINEVCKEHVDNNFLPLPDFYRKDFNAIRERIATLFADTITMTETADISTVMGLRRQCDALKDIVSETYHILYDQLHEGKSTDMSVVFVYLNTLQETQEIISSIRKYLRAFAKLRDTDFSTRNYGQRTAMA